MDCFCPSFYRNSQPYKVSDRWSEHALVLFSVPHDNDFSPLNIFDLYCNFLLKSPLNNHLMAYHGKSICLPPLCPGLKIPALWCRQLPSYLCFKKKFFLRISGRFYHCILLNTTKRRNLRVNSSSAIRPVARCLQHGLSYLLQYSCRSLFNTQFERSFKSGCHKCVSCVAPRLIADPPITR